MAFFFFVVLRRNQHQHIKPKCMRFHQQRILNIRGCLILRNKTRCHRKKQNGINWLIIQITHVHLCYYWAYRKHRNWNSIICQTILILNQVYIYCIDRHTQCTQHTWHGLPLSIYKYSTECQYVRRPSTPRINRKFNFASEIDAAVDIYPSLSIMRLLCVVRPPFFSHSAAVFLRSFIFS